MTTQLTDAELQDLAPLALYPPSLTEWTTPVEGYHGGIPVRAVEGGLRFVIAPWLNMDVDDHVEMFWGSTLESVWTKTIEIDEVDKPVRGTLDAGHIVRGDAYPVFYRVTRRSQQQPEDSQPLLKLLVKLDRPGGYDEDQATPGHSHLKYRIPPAIIENGVGPGEAEAGVPITILPYPFMRKNDRVRLAWGSATKIVTVTEDQASDPVNYPLIITLDKTVIELAGDSAGVAVAYQVVDEVGNHPDERSPWSAISYILVDLGGNRLDAPLVLEADPVTHVIDLETLGDADVTVLVNTTGGHFKANDTIVMTWVGTPAEGSPVIEGPIERPVSRVGVAVTFSIPNAKVRAIAKGRASVSYVLKSQGVTDRPSKNTSVSVEGKISPLRPPSVDEAPGDTLNPIAAKDSLTVVVPQGDLLPSDLLSVTWTGAAGTPAGGSHTTTAAPISTIGREIPIPNSVVAFNLGKAVTVTYTVTRNGTAYPPSQPLNLTVQAIPNEDGALPTPAIDGAVGNELNISTLLDGARTRIAKWPFIALGQKLWLRYSGTNADGTAFTDQTYNAAPIPTDGLPNGMLPHAPVAKLRNLKDGSTLRVEFKVAFDGSTDESTAVTFPVRPYTIKAVAIVAPTLDSVKGSPSGEDIPDNGYTVETAVTLSGTATKGLEVEVFDGATSRGKATANATTGIWTLSVSGLSQTAHRFTAKALYGSGEVSSARAINVTALIAPTLAKVADASGQEIPEAATTTSTTLTLSGKASNGQRVEIYEGNGAGAVSHGIATANATTGEWQHQVTLAQGGRRLYAQSRYHSSTVYTNVRTLTIVPVEAPTLTSVKGSPSGEDIPEGSTTVETAVTLSGTASKGQNVEVFDGTTSKGQATADKATGVWSLLVSGLSESVHRFKAKALYGTGVESAVRTFTVEADADAPIFTNGPYAIQPGGTFKNIILSLQTGSGTPIPNADITLVLPAGFIYADGGSGSRVFRTGTNGLATISGVKGPSAPGGHNMTATYRSKTATARLAIVGVIRTISGFQTPTGLAITPNGTRVYATNLGNHTVSVINTANFAIVDTIAVGKLPKQIASSPDGTYIFVNNPGSSTVSVINTANPTVIKSITGTTPEDGIAFSPDSSLALVSNANGHTVSIIDVANLLLIDTIAVGQTPRGVAFSPDGGLAFICNSDNTVSVMKTSNRTIIETINVGEKPWAIACSPDGTQAFVSNSSSHTVSVIDIATLTVIENISVRLSPAGIAWSPDGSRAFVCNVNAATVSVIDATSLLVTMTITGVHNPRSVVISPDGSRIYVGDQPANTVTVISV